MYVLSVKQHVTTKCTIEHKKMSIMVTMYGKNVIFNLYYAIEATFYAKFAPHVQIEWKNEHAYRITQYVENEGIQTIAHITHKRQTE
jgi:hypothetical protein